MLSPQHRLRRSEDFRQVIRSGKRAGGRYVVVHVGKKTTRVTRVGFVVSKAVGNAVTRNKVKRRLRHILQSLLSNLSESADIVIRAHPRAAQATYSELHKDIYRGLARIGVMQ